MLIHFSWINHHFFGIESPQSHFGRWNLHDILIYRWCIPFECWSNPHFLLLTSNNILAKSDFLAAKIKTFHFIPSSIFPPKTPTSPLQTNPKWSCGLQSYSQPKKRAKSHWIPPKFAKQISPRFHMVPPQPCLVGTPSFPNCLIYRYTPLTFITLW